MKNNVIKKRRSFISFVLSVLIVMMSVGAVLPIAAVSEDPSAAPASNEPVEFTLAQLQELQVPDSDIPSLMTRAQIEEKGHAVRLKAEEPNKNTVIFQNRDGSKTAYFYNTPVKYTDENGIVRDKSSAITAYSGMYDGKSYAYAMTDNDVKVYFSRIGTEGVKLASGGYDIEMVPMNTGSLMIPSVSFENNDTVRYNNMYGLGTAIEYKTLLNGVKEDIVLSNYTGQNSFNFMLYTDGLALVENGGDFYLADNTGARVASIGKVIANDSGNKTVYGTMNYNTVKAGAQYMINISVDTAFLTASDTVYPVRIDPTVTIDQGDSGNVSHNRIEDTGLYESGAYVSGLPSNIYPVGYYSSGTGAGRMAIRFPMFVDPWSDDMSSYYQYLADLKGYQISSATLSLYAESVEGSTTVSVYPMTSTPSYSSTGRECNTSIFNGYDEDYGDSISISSTGRKYFDVTSIVWNWADYSFGNSDGGFSSGKFDPTNGLIIKNNNESDGLKAVSFYSSMYYDPNYQPNLSVTYRTVDTVYINNNLTREFLTASDSSVFGSTSTGLSSMWVMDSVGSDTYIIRSAMNYEKVLGVTNGNLSLDTTTLSSSSLPTKYQWTYSLNQFMNVGSEKYLYYSELNDNINVIGSGTTLGPNAVWDVMNTDEYVELTSFSVNWNGNTNYIEIAKDEPATFSIVYNPSNATWASGINNYIVENDYDTYFEIEGNTVTKLLDPSAYYDDRFTVIFTHKATQKSISVVVKVS